MSNTRYHTRTVYIDAMGPLDAENADVIAAWCGGRVHSEAKASDPTDVAVWVTLPTLGGKRSAAVGQYVVRDETGKFTACNAEKFTSAYEAAPVTHLPQSGVPGARGAQ